MDGFVYLFLSLGFFVPSLIIFFYRKDLRYLIFVLWVLGAFMGIVAEFFYFRDYWRPSSLAGNGVISVEDMLFGAGIVVLSVRIMDVFSKNTGRSFFATSRVRTVATLLFVGVMTLLTLFISGIDSMTSSLLSFLVSIVYISYKSPKLIKKSLATGSVLIGLALVIYAPLFAGIAKDYISLHFMTAGSPNNPVLFGFMPLSEMAWYGTWGVMASLVYNFLNPKVTQK